MKPHAEKDHGDIPYLHIHEALIQLKPLPLLVRCLEHNALNVSNVWNY